MNDRLAPLHVGAVFLLLLLQAALAFCLSFISSIHKEEASRFHQYLSVPYTPKPEIRTRVLLEYAATGVDVGLSIGIAAVIGATLFMLKTPPFIRSAQRSCGWVCLAASVALIVGAAIVPRASSPHNDMFPAGGFLASGVCSGLAGVTAFGVGRLAR